MSYDKKPDEMYAMFGGINSKVSLYDNDRNEFRDLTNLHFFTPGSLETRPGTTLYSGATVSGRIFGGTEFERLNGASYFVVTANTNAYTVTPAGYNSFRSGLAQSLSDFVTFVDRLFVCNGQDFFKFDGTNSYNYGLPAGSSTWGVTAVVGGGLSGVHLATWGYVNERGYYGGVAQGITISLNGSTFGSIQYLGLTNISGYGATAIALYRTSPGGFVQTFATLIPIGSTTFTLDSGASLQTRVANSDIFFTLVPRYMEIYNNQLFMGGFSGVLSTVYWSRIGEPEGVEPEFFAEFRTNDGDRITALKQYSGALLAFKERSFHRITGDNPDNFLLQEVSDQYGCLSNRAVATFQDLCWFLDSKGVVEYNGSNVKMASNKIEPIIQSMNTLAAKDNAAALHVKDLNEVWFAIPTNGATLNNLVIAYDYLADAWTKYEGVNVSSLWLGRGAVGTRQPIFGGYRGEVGYYGKSLCADIGGAMTCMLKTPFINARQGTVESFYRRFYLDVTPNFSATLAIAVNLRTDYGASIMAARQMYVQPFQSRIDFGLSSRSIQAECVYSSASFPIRFNGYAFISRFQRDS